MPEETQPQLPNPVVDAREQADEADSFIRSGKVTAHKTGKEYTFPSLDLLDDDQSVAYNKLMHTLNQCDRWPDTEVPARTVKQTDADGTVTETTVEAHTLRGDIMSPYQKDGELIEPPYNIAMAQILLGDDYDEFKTGGGKSAEVVEELFRIRADRVKRQTDDPKSSGSD